MYVVALIVAVPITVILAGHAWHGGLLRAWVMGVLSAVPALLLFVAKHDSTPVAYLWPMFAVLSIVLLTAGGQLLSLSTPADAGADNIPRGADQPHWAAR